MHLLKELWRGDVPLVKTYWLFGVGGNILFNFVYTYIDYQFGENVGLFVAILILGIIAFGFVYGIFISIAIWRSANKYQGLQRYSIFAKVSVILGVMMLIKAVLELFGVVVTPT